MGWGGLVTLLMCGERLKVEVTGPALVTLRGREPEPRDGWAPLILMNVPLHSHSPGRRPSPLAPVAKLSAWCALPWVWLSAQPRLTQPPGVPGGQEGRPLAGGWPRMLNSQDKNTQLITQMAGSSLAGHTDTRARGPGISP